MGTPAQRLFRRTHARRAAHILPVVREFERPSFKAFREKNRWTLYQAVTHASVKRMSPQRAAEAYGPLNEVLVGSVN